MTESKTIEIRRENSSKSYRVTVDKTDVQVVRKGGVLPERVVKSFLRLMKNSNSKNVPYSFQLVSLNFMRELISYSSDEELDRENVIEKLRVNR